MEWRRSTSIGACEGGDKDDGIEMCNSSISSWLVYTIGTKDRYFVLVDINNRD